MNKNLVPLLDLHAQWEPIQDQISEAIQRVVASQHFILGPEVSCLETDLATYCQARHCIAVSSGTDALLVALMALNIGTGDEVITTPFTFFATCGSIARLGARPVFVDIDPGTYNLDPRQIEGKISARTKAIMPVHLFGQCADMTAILDIAQAHGLAVVEDAAQAIGAEWRGRRAGSMGTAGCFSFFPSKNLGAFGDGGAITSNDDSLVKKMQMLRVHGSKPKYHHHLLGGNFRLDSIQAAILNVKLKHLDHWTSGRQANARTYAKLFRKYGLGDHVLQSPLLLNNRHIFNQFVIRALDRNGLQDHLTKNGIGCEVYYPLPMHLQPCFQYLGYRQGDFPESERAADSVLAIPVFPELTYAQMDLVVRTIRDYYQATGQISHSQAA